MRALADALHLAPEQHDLLVRLAWREKPVASSNATAVDLSTARTMLGALYPVVTLLLGRIVLRERLMPRQLVGIALALAGVALVAAG